MVPYSPSATHLGGELLEQNGRLSLTHVPCKGAGEAMPGVVSGQVDVLVTAAPTAIAQAEVAKALASPDLARRFADQGAEVGAMTPADFQACVRSQVEEWGRVVEAAGVRPD